MAEQENSPPARQGIFTTHPQKYPRATAQAAQLATHLHALVKRGPRSQIATVADQAFHTTQGYVLCTTEMGIIQVYGVPYGSVVPGMRVYARVQGGQATNRHYVFDGFAPAPSSQSETGSILYATYNPAGNAALGVTTASIGTSSSLASAVGYYWHAFVYLPSLPTSACVLLAMWTGSPTSQIQLAQLPSGQLRFASTDGHGYITNGVIAPHQIHWVQVQPGLSGAKFVIDGVANYSGLLSGGDEPTFAGNNNTYTLSVLADGNGANLCPLGSWISKIGFGMNYTGGAAVALSTGTNVPESDSQVPSFNLNSTQQTRALYLCNDTAGSTSAANSAPTGSASALSLTAASTLVSVLGPY